MNTKLNNRTFITALVFLAAITFSAAPAQAGHQGRSYQPSHHGFSVSYCSPNVYVSYGNYQPYSRFSYGQRSRYPSHYGRRSYYNGRHFRRGHATRRHHRGHSSRGRRGRGHGRGHR